LGRGFIGRLQEFANDNCARLLDGFGKVAFIALREMLTLTLFNRVTAEFKDWKLPEGVRSAAGVKNRSEPNRLCARIRKAGEMAATLRMALDLEVA
jgi:hypothetical protein